jgi:hypothetical protein
MPAAQPGLAKTTLGELVFIAIPGSFNSLLFGFFQQQN